MRIRNSYLHRTLSSLSPKRLRSDDQLTFGRSPHVMVSRINGRSTNIEPTSRTFDQEQEIVHEQEEEEERMNVASANRRLIGGWREEEKAMPLKKRRMISVGTDRGKMVKSEEDLMRCGRTDGRRWRCSMRRVEGYSMCEHHLLTRSARYRSEILKREIDEEGDGEKEEEEGCFGNNNNNSNNNNNKRKLKARSINSLVRDTVPLMPLNL